MLRIEDLKVGDELVCIDRQRFKNDKDCDHDILFKDRLIVSFFNKDEVHLEGNDGCWILEGELKYFKKKEEPIFNDLIGVAVQANKDRVINGFSVVGEVLNCQTLDGEDYNLGIGCEVAHGIKYIKSLYKETFVIEKISDELKIKSGAQLILSNGMKCIYFDDGEKKLRHDGDYYPCNFLILKGATVKQSKGAK